MARQKKEPDLDGFLNCAGMLEEKTFAFYKDLSEKVQHPLVKHLLLYIAYDSFKHSVILRKIREVNKAKKKSINCEKNLKNVWEAAAKISQEIFERPYVNNEELRSIIDRLTKYEASLSEDYYVLAQLKTLKLMAKEIKKTYNIDVEYLKDIFELIIMDEDGHREILVSIQGLLIPSDTITITTHTPLVKYKNPDAWYRQGQDLI